MTRGDSLHLLLVASLASAEATTGITDSGGYWRDHLRERLGGLLTTHSTRVLDDAMDLRALANALAEELEK